MSPEIVLAEQGALAQILVDRLGVATRQGFESRRRLSLALPGGSAAVSLLPALAQAPLDWTRWDFFWSDERAVAPDHPDSNYGLGLRLFLGPIGAHPQSVHRMKAEGRDLEVAAAQYESEIAEILGEPRAFDFVLMGMGPDGHICSLFPGHPALREEKRWVLPIADSPKPPAGRVTLTLEALQEAKVVCVAAFGESKAEALRAALQDQASALPVALMLRRARRALLLLDPAAAALLSRS